MNPLKLANPITVTKGVLGLVGTALGVAETVAKGTAHQARSGLERLATSGLRRVGVGEADPDAAAVLTDAPASPESRAVPIEPRAPEEPPVDVVGQALADEAALGDRQSPQGTGFAHEPRAASRDEEHGDAPWQQAETDEIDDEVTAALEGDEVPEEEHLSEPVLDPAGRRTPTRVGE